MELPVLISVSILYTSLLITTTLSFNAGNETDRSALLAFKADISQSPLGTLSSWNDSLHFCQWTGITCGRKHRRVTILDLQSQMLTGSISPYIGNLTFLQQLNLGNNSFSGEIPQQVGRLVRLKHLTLWNNSFGGEIPINVSQCLNLVNLDLTNNKLVGRIPAELGSMSKLTTLYLDSNKLAGSIPSSLGNLSTLSELFLSYNNLDGTIPDDLGQLTSLITIALSYNNLSGMIPPSLYNLSSVSLFHMDDNQLQGNLPFDIGLTLPNLLRFSVVDNKFTGAIPASFLNCSGLQVLQLGYNNFIGSVPNDLGKLENLSFLVLQHNNLKSGDEVDDGLNFLNSLTNCTNLRVLDIKANNFTGMLPSSIGNLSTSLKELRLGWNNLYGSIPKGIHNLKGLIRLDMEFNLFTGSIPGSFGMLKNLGGMTLARNKLTGQIPSSLGNLTKLTILSLASNHLSGRIPSSFGKFRYLGLLELSNNMLNGTIPKQVISLPSLSIRLNLGNNLLSGLVPWEVGKLINLGKLGLYGNKLSGEIPSSLSKCISLTILSMDGNLFEGSIPPSLSSLKGLEELSLSHNNLTGLIPKELENLSDLRILDLSFNKLEGDLPREGVFKNVSGISIVGNTKLCGGIPQLHLPKCPSKVFRKHKRSLSFQAIVPIVVGITLFIVSSTIGFYCIKKSKRKPSVASKFDGRSLEMVSYNEILKATDGFSSSNLLGVGSFGYVYKAVFHEDEKPVAVKVLNLQQRGANKSFMAECEALRNVRHRNLLKIITSCSSIDFQGNDFKALIFELMPNGSLESWLHPSSGDDQLPWRNLGFEQRLNIAIDVASALDYLHHHCETPVVHCDLKPSNVLLDDDFSAHVGDFGLAKFLLQTSTNSTQNQQNSSTALKGSIGYVAPEYGMGSEVSTRGDVYSYGILLLEMFTGKRPTADMFKDGLSLHSFCKIALSSDQVLEIMDACFLLEIGDDDETTNNMVGSIRDIEREKWREYLNSIVQIGVLCSVDLPAERMDMESVVMELHIVLNLFRGINIQR